MGLGRGVGGGPHTGQEAGGVANTATHERTMTSVWLLLSGLQCDRRGGGGVTLTPPGEVMQWLGVTEEEGGGGGGVKAFGAQHGWRGCDWPSPVPSREGEGGSGRVGSVPGSPSSSRRSRAGDWSRVRRQPPHC